MRTSTSDEFRNEVDDWVIDAIKSIGIETAKSLLNAPRDMVIEKTDLEEETIDDVIRIVKKEFERIRTTGTESV